MPPAIELVPRDVLFAEEDSLVAEVFTVAKEQREAVSEPCDSSGFLLQWAASRTDRSVDLRRRERKPGFAPVHLVVFAGNVLCENLVNIIYLINIVRQHDHTRTIPMLRTRFFHL